MNSWLAGLAFSAVVSNLAGFLMGWWAKHYAGIKPTVGIAIESLETRLGHKAPVWVLNAINSILDEGVAIGNKIMSDGPLVRNMIRGLANGDASKLAVIESQLASVDWSGAVMKQLPEEYKEAVNAAVHLAVTNSTTAKIEKTIPPEFHPAPVVLKNMIEKTVVAQKVNEPPKLVTTNDIERMISESKARQEALKK